MLIGQFLVVGFIFTLQAPLQCQALVLLSALQAGRCLGHLVEGVSLEARLALQLLTVPPVLDGPGQCSRSAGQHHQQQAYEDSELSGDQVEETHNTALALPQSCSRSSKPLRPPLIRRVMVLNCSLSASRFSPFTHQNHAADSAAQANRKGRY
ncbi:hypothetical protein BHC62_06145 [Pseudomonas sp. 06C 126]|nr:hypothetical protein BHC62_06145 [Pseudomonas sp. 06C 126]